nr:unnamed protein product [Callosobruchus analis]
MDSSGYIGVDENPPEKTHPDEEDGRKEEDRVDNLQDATRKYWQLILKLVEIVICIMCIGFMYEPTTTYQSGLGKTNFPYAAPMYTAFGGYIVINATLILGALLGESTPFRIVAIFAAWGTGLFLTTGILLISHKMNIASFYAPHMHLPLHMTTAIILSFVNVMLMALEAALTFVLKRDFQITFKE